MSGFVRLALRLALIALIGSSFILTGPTYAAGVVGNGTPASCTEDALRSALTGGGDVTFNCGAAPVTIMIATTLDITAPNTTIDGGNLITLQGSGTRVIRHRSLSSASTLALRNLTITGGVATGTTTAANGAGVQSIFQGASPSFQPILNIENVTFINNDATLTSASGNSGDFGGGAIYSQGGSVNVLNSTFTGNDANNAAGGAIHILQSTLAIENSTFDDNSAIGSIPENSQGGAIYVDGLNAGAGGFFRITGSSFRRNTSYNSGGAIYVNMYENSNQFTVDQSSFIDNAIIGGSGALGGAISGGSTTSGANTGNAGITITNSTFAGNSARRSGSPQDGSGGALAFAQRAVLTITNSTFFENSANGSSFNANGGALYVVNNTTPFQVTNSTFANNTAGWVGGAISNSEISGAPGGIVRNTLFSHNTADNGPNDWNIQQHCSSELSDGGNNLQYPPRLTNANFFNDVTCFEGKSQPEQTNLPDFRDPKLATLADTGGPTQTIALAHDSPAINSGNSATCPTTDQRNTPRNGICDIGAHEFSNTPYVSAITPAFAAAGEPGFTLTVLGADFDQGSTVLWNGAPRATQFVSSTRLTATIPDSDLTSAGDIAVNARNNAGTPAPTARTFHVLEAIFRAYLPLVVQ